jgi:hypothetical protein
MLKFTKNVFREFMEVFLWLNLIGSAITGGVLGYGIDENGGHAFIGIILGVVIGIISNILIGGFIAVILNIDSNLEKLKVKIVGNEEGKVIEGGGGGAKVGNVEKEVKHVGPFDNTSNEELLKIWNERNSGSVSPKMVADVDTELSRRGILMSKRGG